ncbi:MAG: helix-turn-helix domain-containing protein [Lentisphaeria bacterium]|nr:helix-turn-helix domain-containing protein [Lentisphaeria bacterium]
MEQYLFHQFRSIPENYETSRLFHAHEFWQVDFIYEGAGCLLVSEKNEIVRYDFQSGSTVIIPPGLEHCFDYCNKSSAWLSVKFSASGNIGGVMVLPAEKMLEYTAAILAEALSPHTMSRSASLSIVNAALSVAFNRFTLELKEQKSHTSEFVRKVKEFVYSQQGRDVRVSDVGDFMQCTGKHAALRFHSETGTSLKKFLDETRADFAARLLLTSSKSLNALARQLEFRDVYAFSRFFKRVTGKTLSEYRNHKPYSC